MQQAFDFGAAADIAYMRDQLRAAFGRLHIVHRLEPVGQLVKSLVSGRTYDEVSWPAYLHLVHLYPWWADLAAASPAAIEAAIGRATYPDQKAGYIKAALLRLQAERGDFNLDFLADWPVEAALAWLERFDGVGRKVSAATLNFSTLDMPAFVIDTHVLRVLQRFGLVRRGAEAELAYERMMPALGGWSAAELRDLHVLIKRLGQTYCGAMQADCPHCPIAQRCRTMACNHPRGSLPYTGNSSRMRVPRSGLS